MTSALYLSHAGVVCALGAGLSEVRAGLFSPSLPDWPLLDDVVPGRRLPYGRVDDAWLPSTAALSLPLRSRNNALLLCALAQIRAPVDAAIERYGRDRVGVVLGTSTSGIAEAEAAIAAHRATGQLPAAFLPSQLEMGSPAAALSELLGLAGPALVISTACSSSAKAIMSAARLISADLCDAVITGGVDSFSRFTTAGFAALEAVSDERCRPLSRHRNGINLGEGGALFLLDKAPAAVRLAGWGESSDAHHISAPAPDGRGAHAAMNSALARAGLNASDVDYINLHGTATPQNDAMESLALARLFGDRTPVSSTKPLTGHALGGAGALEAALAWIALTDNPRGELPPHWWDGVPDPALPPLNPVAPGQSLGRPLDYVLSNSFAFGGSNASLILGRG